MIRKITVSTLLIIILCVRLFCDDEKATKEIEIFLCTSYDNSPELNYSLTNDFYVYAVGSVWGFNNYPDSFMIIDRNKTRHLYNVPHRPLD